MAHDEERKERAALSRFGEAMSNSAWHNNQHRLSEEVSIREWFGVRCEKSSVRSIDLKGNGLQGSIPSDIGMLTKVEVLRFGGNRPEDHRGCADTNFHRSSLTEEIYS